MKPILSIFWPSDSKVSNVTSSRNIAKQTVFFERLVICKDIIERHFLGILQNIICYKIEREKGKEIGHKLLKFGVWLWQKCKK
jgi:hypothetical protein